jgi:uncharacterized membrane protein YjjP (DUF1212 family)
MTSEQRQIGPALPDDTTVNLMLDVALRIGEVLMASGAGASDVTATVIAVTSACGLRGRTTAQEASTRLREITRRSSPLPALAGHAGLGADGRFHRRADRRWLPGRRHRGLHHSAD